MTPDPTHLYTYKAIILRVVDGDTIALRIFVGFFLSYEAKVRLLSSSGGVNTPELHAPDPAVRLAAKNAMLRTMMLAPVGTEVLIKTELDNKDDFGRILAQIVNAKGENVGDVLLAEGRAVVWERK